MLQGLVFKFTFSEFSLFQDSGLATNEPGEGDPTRLRLASRGDKFVANWRGAVPLFRLCGPHCPPVLVLWRLGFGHAPLPPAVGRACEIGGENEAWPELAQAGATTLAASSALKADAARAPGALNRAEDLGASAMSSVTTPPGTLNRDEAIGGEQHRICALETIRGLTWLLTGGGPE